MPIAVVRSCACCSGEIFVVWNPSSRYQIDGDGPKAWSAATSFV